MIRYGYFSENKSTNSSSKFSTNNNTTNTRLLGYKKNLTEAIYEFQEFMGIKKTGVIDQTTMKLMMKPRCGIKDKLQYKYPKVPFHIYVTPKGRRKIRSINSRSFSSGDRIITWSITFRNRPTNPYVLVDIFDQVEYGLNMWSAVTNIKFRRLFYFGSTGDVLVGFFKSKNFLYIYV